MEETNAQNEISNLEEDNDPNRTRDVILNYKILEDAEMNLLPLSGIREVGSSAVWSVSSCKQGYGVSLLRDDNLETYWQSDGAQPHTVNIQFRQKTALDSICFYTDYKADESYTPSELQFRGGNHYHDLKVIENIDIHTSTGWVVVKLREKVSKKHIRAFILQMKVLQNHQNGRDTHLRQIKVFSPINDCHSMDKILNGHALPNFTTTKMSMYSTIR